MISNPITLVATIVMLSIANLLVAAGARQTHFPGPRIGFASAAGLLDWRLAAGMALYALAFVLYLTLLARGSLSAVYPVLVGGTFALVLAGSTWMLGEHFSTMRITGSALIALGVFLCLRG
jgi:drug/metabolite transporter (DMT)-like permease